MKKLVTLFIIVCFTLVGCTPVVHEKEVGGFDRKGIITEIDSETNRILVDDAKNGLIWLGLPYGVSKQNYMVGQEVVAWIDGGVDDSEPQQAMAKNVEITKEISLPPFDFKNTSFPPNPKGIIVVNGAEYDMEMGGFQWEKGNQAVTTDAASPSQIAERFEAIVLEPNSKVNIVIEQKPNINVFLWDSEITSVDIEGTQITAPENIGRYIYEVVARWSSGTVSYTFVIEVE
jgi:hypothetical protein